MTRKYKGRAWPQLNVANTAVDKQLDISILKVARCEIKFHLHSWHGINNEYSASHEGTVG